MAADVRPALEAGPAIGAPGPAAGASRHNLEHGAVPGRVTSFLLDDVRTEPT